MTAMATNPDFMIEDRVDLYELFRANAADAAPRHSAKPEPQSALSFGPIGRVSAFAGLGILVKAVVENPLALALGFMAGLLVTVGLADLLAVTVLS